MKHEIIGDDMQVAIVEMEEGEFVQADAGSMFFMEGSIDMDLRMPGGWVGGLKRMFLGESFMLPVFKAKSSNSKVAFAPPYPGKILELEVNNQNKWQAQKDSFLFATSGVGINISFIKKFKVGFFGGEGFILEKFTGAGKVFINCGGTAIQKTLAEKEVIQVDTGCVVAFEESVQYDIKRVKNLKTAILGGEGLFLTTLTGPGKIILQSLPWSRFQNVMGGGKGSTGPLGDVGRIFGGD
ncbi:MAG: TIGR00266 family protein [Candidatus Melainabacteria bacterium]|nr:TIGR00266 family protein [Candidatus Melainabacteria bacterium]